MVYERTYRSNFVVVALLMSAICLAAMPLMPGRFVRLMRVPGYMPAVIAIYVGLWAFAYLVCWFFTLQVGPDGIRGYNGAGTYYEVPWRAMRGVRKVPGYLLVDHGDWGTALSVPGFLRDDEEFREYVVAHAPEGNPLRVAYEKG